MVTRVFCAILLIATSCQYGMIPCIKVRPDKVKKTHVRKIRYVDRSTTASVREIPAEQVKPNYSRGSEVKPALENIDVEEWDCPKPGTKKNIPKALKDNIRKNKKAYETHYRNKIDSITTVQPMNLE